MRLGPEVSVQQILDKLETIYGTVEAGDMLHSQFYAAQLQTGESTVAWGLRDRMVHWELVGGKEARQMLRGQFWN